MSSSNEVQFKPPTCWRPIGEIGDRSRFDELNPVLIGWTNTPKGAPYCVVASWEGDTPSRVGGGWVNDWTGDEIEAEPEVFMIISRVAETTYRVTDLIPGSKFKTPAGWFVVPEGVTQMLITVSITGGASAVGKGGGKTWPDIQPTKEEPQ